MTTTMLKTIPENIKSWHELLFDVDNMGPVILKKRLEIDNITPLIYLSIQCCNCDECDYDGIGWKEKYPCYNDGNYDVFTLSIDNNYYNDWKSFVNHNTFK